MQKGVDTEILIFKALSDTKRLQIVKMLAGGELCGCRLLAHFKITQPTLSHHMKVLVGCGLVQARREGVWMYYSLNGTKAERFIGFIQSLLKDKQGCACMEGLEK